MKGRSVFFGNKKKEKLGIVLFCVLDLNCNTSGGGE